MTPTEAETQLLQRLDKAERRLDGIERNASDLSKTLTGVIDNHRGLFERLTDIEKADFAKQIEDARAGEREKRLQEDIASMKSDITAIKNLNIGGIKEDVTKINEGFNKLFWLVVAGIVTGCVGLVFVLIKGGLSV